MLDNHGKRVEEFCRSWRSTRVAIMVSAVLMVAAGTFFSTNAADAAAKASAQTTLTLYSGQHPQTTQAIVNAFEVANPNIKVLVRNGDEDTYDAQIVAEGSRSPADVFYSENSPALEFLQQRGLLAKIDASTLAQSPAR